LEDDLDNEKDIDSIEEESSLPEQEQSRRSVVHEWLELDKNWECMHTREVIRAVQECLKETSSGGLDKVLVFSPYLGYLDCIGAGLTSKGIEVFRFDGTVSQPERKRIIEQFNNPEHEIRVMLITQASGSFGVNLPGANHVIQASPDFVPSVEDQAIGRAYRIGQKKRVISYKFIGNNSIHNRYIELQDLKKKKARYFLSDLRVENHDIWKKHRDMSYDEFVQEVSHGHQTYDAVDLLTFPSFTTSESCLEQREHQGSK
jgi:SNF2 family DNA or RNA helicase